jgi:malonate-semialdehyde dehydrogenase (acetylating)/methylmalonate-semialdehyde dehydrogenase
MTNSFISFLFLNSARTSTRKVFAINYPILQQVAYQSGGPTKVKNYINGEFTESQATKWIELRNPVSWVDKLTTDI